jgi:hypothetical protein
MTDILKQRDALLAALKGIRSMSHGGDSDIYQAACMAIALVESDKTSSNDNLSIHVHRAADKLFENDLIDGDLIRYDYLIEAAQMLRSITSPSTAQGGENE